ncbi:hypothetical protein IFR05_008709 [Cadophora sp. M221]|nr:hypothetical protein IFR05_008709 [Cadophora sp. M221]
METNEANEANGEIPLGKAFREILDQINLENGSGAQTQDRFTTTWTGPDDSRAMAFGTLINNVKAVLDKETGALVYQVNGKHLDDEVRRKMNLAYDEVLRLRNSEDQHQHTGTGFGEEDWNRKTRGEKLRFVSLPLLGYDHLVRGLRSVVEEIEGGFQDPEISAATALIVGVAQHHGTSMERVVELLKKDMDWVKVMKMHYQNMKTMVLEEAKDGWDWKVGMDEQNHLIGVIMPLAWDEFSCYFWAVLNVNIDTERSDPEVKEFVRDKIII